MQPDTRERNASSFQDLCARMTELETQQAEVRRALVERMKLASGRVDFTTTLDSLRRGELSIVEALSEQFPDVFRTEVLPKLDLRATLNLAQVSKSFRDAVWSVDGVRSMKAKLKGLVIHRTGRCHRETRILCNRGETSSLIPGNVDRVALITRENYSVYIPCCENPLCFAATFGSSMAVKALLDSGEDVNQLMDDGFLVAVTALHLAASHDHIALVKLLIEAGADVNKQTIHDYTALVYAAQYGHASCVMALLRAGADVNLCTPIIAAVATEDETCVALLIGAGADVRKCNDEGKIPMHEASFNRNARIVKLLKDAGA